MAGILNNASRFAPDGIQYTFDCKILDLGTNDPNIPDGIQVWRDSHHRDRPYCTIDAPQTLTSNGVRRRFSIFLKSPAAVNFNSHIFLVRREFNKTRLYGYFKVGSGLSFTTVWEHFSQNCPQYMRPLIVDVFSSLSDNDGNFQILDNVSETDAEFKNSVNGVFKSLLRTHRNMRKRERDAITAASEQRASDVDLEQREADLEAREAAVEARERNLRAEEAALALEKVEFRKKV